MQSADCGDAAAHRVEEHRVCDARLDLAAVVAQFAPRVGRDVVGVEAAEGGVTRRTLTVRYAADTTQN